jgi:hypothetical protein
VTYSRGKRRGPGLVLTAAAGYPAPSLLGAGAAVLIAAGHPAALLWLALVLLAATFLAVRNAFGALAVLVTAAGVFVVSYFASAAVQAGFAYLAAWFLLLGGMRPALELTHDRRPRNGRGNNRANSRGSNRGSGRGSLSDADQLARLTGVSRGVWVTAFILVATAALALGTRLLIP